MNIKDIIVDSLERLHMWREHYNGSDVGFGADELFGECETKKHFPHGYAIWGKGYMNMFHVTADQEYLACAERCADWLINNPSPDYKNLSWGLPFGWHNTKPTLSYCITTLYAADLLCGLYAITKKECYADALSSIRRWLLEENGYMVDYVRSRGIWFKYAPTEHRFTSASIYNVTAKAAGFFAQLCDLSIGDYDENVYYASSCARYIIAKQELNGSWCYGDASPIIDLAHSGLVMEGLYTFLEFSGLFDKEIKRSAYKAYNFMKRMVREGHVSAFRIDPKKALVSMHGWYQLCGYAVLVLMRAKRLFDYRLYGYAMSLKGLFMMAQIAEINFKEEYLDCCVALAKNFQKPNGAFGFKARNRNEYIRAEGHIFESLSAIAAQL